MRKLASGLLVATAAILAVGPGAALSSAATTITWTVTPGGNFAGSSSQVTFTDTTTGVNFVCASSSMSGTLKSGSGLAGAKIGTITALSFSNCTGPGGFTYTVTTSVPYYLNVQAYDAASGETTVTVNSIEAVFSSINCLAYIDGTAFRAHDGKVTGKYTNSTHKLAIITSGSNLHLYNVSQCGGLFNSGDAMSISGTYTITPAQTITSP